MGENCVGGGGRAGNHFFAAHATTQVDANPVLLGDDGRECVGGVGPHWCVDVGRGGGGIFAVGLVGGTKGEASHRGVDFARWRARGLVANHRCGLGTVGVR